MKKKTFKIIKTKVIIFRKEIEIEAYSEEEASIIAAHEDYKITFRDEQNVLYDQRIEH